MEFDINSLTVAEAKKVEDLAGQKLADFANGDTPNSLVMAAMYFVLKRRTDPGVTWTQVCNMPMTELSALFVTEEEDKEDPKESAPKSKPKSKKGTQKN